MSDDKMQMGKVELPPQVQKVLSDRANESFREYLDSLGLKPPKRVAVAVATYGDGVCVVASDGTAWAGIEVKGENGWQMRWTRLSDLPQE